MPPSAQEFVHKLEALKSAAELKKIERYFPVEKRGDDQFIGVRMGQIFALAKEFVSMDLANIEKLLKSDIHEVRVGAVSIMDFQARSKKTTAEQHQALYDLYLRRHDRINSWDLVDRSAIYVIGKYLFDKKRDVLYSLAHSKNTWERRTAMLSTAYFLKYGQVDDALKISEILVDDNNEYIHKAVGWMLRVVGDKDQPQLLAFLDKHAKTMPRIMLRYAIEKLDKKQRQMYLGMK